MHFLTIKHGVLSKNEWGVHRNITTESWVLAHSESDLQPRTHIFSPSWMRFKHHTWGLVHQETGVQKKTDDLWVYEQQTQGPIYKELG